MCLSLILQKNLKGEFSTFKLLGQPTPNERKILNYMKKIHPVWASYETLRITLQTVLGKHATVDNRIRGLHQKGYLDKHTDREGTVRFRVRKEVMEARGGEPAEERG